MHFISHKERSGHDFFDVEAAAHGFNQFFQHRCNHLIDKFQIFHRLRSYITKAQLFRFWRLINQTVPVISIGFVLDNEHRHGRGCDAGHGANRCVKMTGRQFHLSAYHQPVRFLKVVSPPLIKDRSLYRVLLCVPHSVPCDGGACVHDHVFFHARTGVDRLLHIHPGNL